MLKLKKSSNIKEASFDGHILTVEFHQGRIYQYVGVTQEMCDEWLEADSVGSWFCKNIKNNSDLDYRWVNKPQEDVG